MRGLTSAIHSGWIKSRRVDVLTSHLTEMIPAGCSVLDIGCGDGVIASELLRRRPDLKVRGVELVVRSDSAIPVEKFDGATLPLLDRSVDVCLLIDVLHHTEQPADLLKEAVRVASRRVVLKDHYLQGVAAQRTLRFMDRIGNANVEIPMPENYLSPVQWRHLYQESGLELIEERSSLGLYPIPLSFLFERSLHFISALEVKRPPQ